jgi:hypothetical protein
MAIRLTHLAASAAAGDGTLHGLAGYIGSGGKIKIYTGNVNADHQLAPAGTELAELVITGSFSNSTTGAITTTAVGTDAAEADGTAGCFALFQSDGTTKVLDGSVGEGTGDISFDETAWVETGTVALTDNTFTITVPVA